VTVGLNYKPNDNVIFRSECRWDWVDPHSPLVADGPFNDFEDRHQPLSLCATGRCRITVGTGTGLRGRTSYTSATIRTDTDQRIVRARFGRCR